MTAAQVRKIYPHQFVLNMIHGREVRKHDRRERRMSVQNDRRKAERRETVQ